MAVDLIDDSNFESVIAENERVIVKYFAGWCGSCRLMAPKYKRLSNDDNFTGVKFVEIDAENSPASRKVAGVTNLPFIATFKNGKLLETAPTSKEELIVEMIKQL